MGHSPKFIPKQKKFLSPQNKTNTISLTPTLSPKLSDPLLFLFSLTTHSHPHISLTHDAHTHSHRRAAATVSPPWTITVASPAVARADRSSSNQDGSCCSFSSSRSAETRHHTAGFFERNLKIRRYAARFNLEINP